MTPVRPYQTAPIARPPEPAANEAAKLAAQRAFFHCLMDELAHLRELSGVPRGSSAVAFGGPRATLRAIGVRRTLS